MYGFFNDDKEMRTDIDADFGDAVGKRGACGRRYHTYLYTSTFRQTH